MGINESGKTNILRALSLVGPEFKTTIADKREALKTETKEIDEAFVRFFFKPDEDDYEEIFEELKGSFLSTDLSIPLINISGRDYSLEEFLKYKEVFYEANIISSSKTTYHFALKKTGVRVAANWKEITDACPTEFVVEVSGSPKPLKDFKYVNVDEYTGIPADYIESPAHEELNSDVGSELVSFVKKNLPPVIFWTYDESKNLPSRIPLQEFMDSPGSCIPLKRMFELKGITDVAKAIGDAQKAGGKALDNLLGRVADCTTKYFHETWDEYDDVSFALKINGLDIETSVQDTSNSFDIEQRSDGFKRFVTFLLVVSARAKAKALERNLILIDEPEIGLHPSGARYLRDELIDVSVDNLVVFSTHSIFMIDNNLIARHLIVKKEKEVTTIKQADPTNLLEEEVIYKALGHSIYASLREKNIVFEGWHDKQLYNLAINARGKAALKRRFDGTGICHAQGVKDIKNISPVFESGDRKLLILTDNDAAAKSNQKEFTIARGYGVWKRYEEVVSGCAAITGEDFVSDAAFTTPLAKIAQDNNFQVDPAVPNLSTATLGGTGKIAAIQGWFIRNGLTGEPLKAAMRELKDDVFVNLTAAEIEAEYYIYLENVASLTDSL